MFTRQVAAVLSIVLLASGCGSGSDEAATASGGGDENQVTTTAPDAAFSDPEDAAEAEMEIVRDACIQDLVAADPGLGLLLDKAAEAGGADKLVVEEHVTLVTRATECSPPQLIARRLERAIDQDWLTVEQRDCLATAVKGSETQGMAYLGLLNLLNGRLDVPDWSGAGQDPAIIGATACVSPVSPILGESVASLLEDPRTAAAVDIACLEELFAPPEQRVNFWLQRYRRVVYREPDDDSMKLVLEGSTQRCLNTGVLYQASLWTERGIEISNETAACIDEKVRPSDYAMLNALGDPSAEEILATAAGECVTAAERAQFGDE